MGKRGGVLNSRAKNNKSIKTCYCIYFINIDTIIYSVCNKFRKASCLLFLGVHWSSVQRQRRFDSLPAIRGPNDVRRSSVEEPHRHLDKADVSGSNIHLQSEPSVTFD